MTASPLRRSIPLVAALCLIGACVALATPPVTLSEVAATDDLVAEVTASLSEIELALTTPESYRQRLDAVRRTATQLAISAQALAEHEGDSTLKHSAPTLRELALKLSTGSSHDEATGTLNRLKAAFGGEVNDEAQIEFDWSRLARLDSVMSGMKFRSEALRRAFRKPGDLAVDSRHATAIALLALVAHEETRAIKDPADKPLWRELARKTQQHFTQTALELRAKDASAADHFRLGMETCHACHEKFKP